MPFLISCAAPPNTQLPVDAIPNFDTEAVRLDDKNIAVAGHLNCLLRKDTLAKLFAIFLSLCQLVVEVCHGFISESVTVKENI